MDTRSADPDEPERHAGSIDVDVALNHKELTGAGCRMIGEILRQHGYTQDRQQPFIFRKLVRGQVGQVVGSLAGGTGKGRRTPQALDIQLCRARGCDLAFQIPLTQVALKGTLPDPARWTR